MNNAIFETNITRGEKSDSELLKMLLFVCMGEGVHHMSDIKAKVLPIAEDMRIEDAYHKLRSVLQTCMSKSCGTSYNHIERIKRATYAITYKMEAFD